MSEEKFTRCPGCRTVFRVTDAQLALRGGQVRCGHCHAVFDGVASRVSLAPRTARVASDYYDEAALGPPTVTLRSAHSLQPAPSPQHEEPPPPIAPDEPGEDAPRADYEHRFARNKPRTRPRRTALYASVIALLLLLLAGQALVHFRDNIAAHWPATRPALASLCNVLGCAVRPLRDVAALSIEASDLQADPAHKGLLTLTATVRNRAVYTLAYPHLELTLTDAQDQVVVRRALAPADYAGGTVDPLPGIPGNGEVAIKLFIDASATSQAGYRLYLFYP
jgi:predicted Zn finger-like uncharacterized protein